MRNKVDLANMNQEKKRELKPKLRFPEFQGAGEWEEKELKPYLEEYSERVAADTDLPIYSSTRSGLQHQKAYYNGRELVNDGEYGVVPDGFFVYRHMSDDGTFKININKTGGRIAVSKEYPVFSTVDLHPDFLLYKINYGDDFKRFALMQKKGGTRTRLYFRTLCSWNTLLPLYPEQQKIADCLSSLDDCITAQTQKLDTLKVHKKGLMQQLFPAEGETLPKLRFPEFWDAGEWDIDELWKVSCFVNEKISLGKLTLDNYVSTENILPEYEGLITASKLPSSGSATKFKLNDILISNIRPYLKKVWLSNKEGGASNDVIIVRSKEKINYQYLSFVLKNDVFIEYVMKGAKGVKMPRGDISLMKEYPLTYPSKLEQQKIADCLSSLDNCITAQTQKLDTLKVHKKGLMQQLFPAFDEVKG
jgi:type I restriction enzyme, S subunit